MKKLSLLSKKPLIFLLTGAALSYAGVTFAQSAFAASTEEVPASSLDLSAIFAGSPIIYSTLIALSLFSFTVWLYSLITLRLSDMMPREFIEKIREEILENRFESALSACQRDGNFSAHIIACGLVTRKHGAQVILDSMKSEGGRCGATLWQRISLLNDVSVIAPMLGLLGTVLGMFYAFYDTARTAETITSIFDGLGVAIGTTVAGLVVAIIAMIFYTTLKFRVVRLLNTIENEVLSLGSLIGLEAEKKTEDN